jgi:hypothetical protein
VRGTQKGAGMKLRRLMRAAIAASVALIGLAMAPAAVASAGTGEPPGKAVYNCTGGNIPAGVYRSMRISGICYMPSGNVVIRGNLTVTAGALLDAVAPGDPTTGTPVVPATVFVGGNVFVGSGGVLLLGCSPNISCGNPPGITYDIVRGNLIAIGAQGVVLHSASIRGSVTIVGGGGGAAAQACTFQTPTQPTIANLQPWSEDPNLDFTPVYSDIEDVSIGGNLTVSHLTSCWLGSLRDQVGRSARFVGNTMGDPDAMEVANNLVKGNMVCADNMPQVQFGDGMSAPNLVSGFAVGECGFKVTQPNPAPNPSMKQPAGVEEHISVRTGRLKTYFGTYSSTLVKALPNVTTSAGDTLIAELSNFSITGHRGLTGTGTVDSTMPPGQSGQAFVATAYPSGLVKFTVFDTCTCTFKGQTGTITLRAYGEQSRDGSIRGTFLVTSGGGPAAGGSLSTLAGYGTFSNFNEPANTLRLVEHLAIT